MNDSFFRDLIVAIDDLAHEIDGLTFRNIFFIINKLREITLVTKLCDNVCIIFGCVYIKKLDDVLGAL